MPPSFDPDSIEVTPEQTAAALADASAQVIDVRELYEWEAGRIEGAKHIELQELKARSAEIDSDRPVIFHCRLGARSLMAAQAVRGIGIDSYSMAGGLERWANESRPLIPAGGVVANH